MKINKGNKINQNLLTPHSQLYYSFVSEPGSVQDKSGPGSIKNTNNTVDIISVEK
jgi:hypothetical protein